MTISKWARGEWSSGVSASNWFETSFDAARIWLERNKPAFASEQMIDPVMLHPHPTKMHDQIDSESRTEQVSSVGGCPFDNI